MRFEYAILGLVAIFSFVLLVSAAYPDSISANAITTPVISPGKAVAVQQPTVEMESGFDIIKRQIFADLASLRNDVSKLNSRLTNAEGCCQDSRQDIGILEERLTQLEQRVTRQERAGGQEAPSAADMFGQCQVLGTGVTGDNCNAVCAGLRKTCVVALYEGFFRGTATDYRFTSCSDRTGGYATDQWTARFSCYCC